MPKSDALTQCAMRSVVSNRWIGVSGGSASPPAPASGGVVVAAIRPPDPSIDVVAVALPVAGLDPVGELDGVQPLAGLVAVHRRDVQADGTAVLRGDVAALHLV